MIQTCLTHIGLAQFGQRRCPHTQTNHAGSEYLSAVLVRLLSAATGAAVANSYYNQAFLSHLTADFGWAAEAAAIVSVLTQAGNALGALFLPGLGIGWNASL